MGFKPLFFALLIFSSFAAQAYEDEGMRGYISTSNESLFNRAVTVDTSLSPGERLRRFNLALDSLKIPRESTPDFSEFPTADQVSFEAIQSRLAIMDPDAGLRRYLKLEPSSVTLHQDFWSSLLPQSLEEFSLALKPSGNNEDSNELLARLDQVSSQVKDPSNSLPLSGLKVVIDPGHMGTPFWDEETGKYVEIKGVRVSEGQINLWTALLTANELESLGAKVTLTRSIDGSVSAESSEQFDVSPYLNQYFYSSLDSWMSPLLSLSDSDLINRVRSAPETKKAYTSTQKTQFYITGADLEARSKMIDEEKPDVVIDIHFDADKANQLQSNVNRLEAFVPGSFRKDETGSRAVKSYALKHLLETRRWDESVKLAGEITSLMSKNLQIPLETTPGFLTSIRVKDGVYARNLYINRRNLSSLMVYLECLHYDHVSEFPLLAKKNQSASYHGMNFQYPARLNLISASIRDGILNYFKN